ncbi:MAG: hypothetical protein SYC29_01780 [Planctomycetota bacterium]|nr:hypothetical protein [Planctomycetota bacterium]
MLKLYRHEGGRVTAYHEAWVDGETVVEHWGILGEQGSVRKHRLRTDLTQEENIQRVLSQATSQGFQPIDIDDHKILLIEYPVEGMGTVTDLERRHAMEERMRELMGWTGLGTCDGGSIGSGTMEVCCFVVDFETAKRCQPQPSHAAVIGA